MIIEFTIQHFKQWQLEHYTQRMKDAKDLKEKMWLRTQLFHLKKTTDE